MRNGSFGISSDYYHNGVEFFFAVICLIAKINSFLRGIFAIFFLKRMVENPFQVVRQIKLTIATFGSDRGDDKYICERAMTFTFVLDFGGDNRALYVKKSVL